MMKHKEVTDYEINKAVAKYLKLNIIAYDRTGIVLFDDMDAMPIIIENKICMNYIDKDIGWGARHFDEEKGELEIYDKHYYRAAMICFLIMKEAENEK
ncbi:TPA: hypothetical protein ACI4BU_003294 [Morganella morganii]